MGVYLPGGRGEETSQTAGLARLTVSSALRGTARRSAEQMDRAIESLGSGFGADQSVLVHFGDPALFDDIVAGRFFRVLRREDAALNPFDTFLNGSAPRCGQVRDSQRNFLFHGDADEVGSMALVPLGDKARIGFLAIGSADADRFHPGMSIDFLARVGDLVAGALERF